MVDWPRSKMDQLSKEFQAFAGRFSAVATDRLDRVDGGTYFSRLYQTNHTTDEEQRQIGTLLEELQLAMESPLLLAPPQGTVLHTGMAEGETSLALARLCVALEKCVFFGAEGSMPDFWRVLGGGASEGADARSPAAVSSGGDLDGFNGQGNNADVGSGSEEGGDTKTRGDRAPDPLAAVVGRLTRVHTGHARCRAWARGLLGVDGASAASELRKAVAAAVQLTRNVADGAAVGTGNEGQGDRALNDAIACLTPSEEQPVDLSNASHDANPDTGGGGGGDSPRSGNTQSVITVPLVAEEQIALSAFEHVHDAPSFAGPGSASTSPSQLPLWLRPGRQGASVVDELCRIVVELSVRLKEREQTVRPSLDHAWLDQENVAAVTTYTWPQFRRTKLRCYVRGAGLSAANGEYLPAERPEDGEGATVYGGDSSGGNCPGLSLIGPNGCNICCLHRPAAAAAAEEKTVIPGGDSAAVGAGKPGPTRRDRGAANEEDVRATQQAGPPTISAESPTTITPALVAQVWHLLVPAASSPELVSKRSAYYCLGDGPLPPSRGWRSAEATEAPAPVLGFATQEEDDGDVAGAGGIRIGREGPNRVKGEEEEADDTAALFRAAVLPPIDDERRVGVGELAAGGGSTSRGVGLSTVAARASVEAEGLLGGESSVADTAAVGSGRLKRRRKRQRPPELVGNAVLRTAEQNFSVLGEVAGRDRGGDCDDGGVSRGGGGGGGSDVRGGRAPGDDGDGAPPDCGGDDEAVAAFKAERWRLPSPSGELRSRVEKSRELLLRTMEEQRSMLASRRSQLQDQVTVAQRELQEVMQEPTEITAERLLSARPGLREQAEAEVAMARATAAGAGAGAAADGSGGSSKPMVPSLEELVAEKAEELRIRAQNRGHVDAAERLSFSSSSSSSSSPSSSSSSSSGHWVENDDQDQQPTARDLGAVLPAAVTADAGWPWPVAWLAAPPAPPPPPRDPEDWELGLEEGTFGFGVGVGAGFAGSSGHGDDFTEGAEDGADPPVPYSIEVAAVEVVDAEHLDEAHVEYVLRLVFHEVQEQQGKDAVSETPGVLDRGNDSRRSRRTKTTAVHSDDDRGAAELVALTTAAKGLLQRTRVLSKRLNSLCALHPQLMWELEEARRLRSKGEAEVEIAAESLDFPDPFELGTLEEKILRVHCDKLTPNFKANSPTRKLAARVGSYLSGLLRFLGVLEAVGEADVRSRMSRVLHDALSTCDRVGRKRRRGDFALGVRVRDIAGGKLGSGAGDEERLRVQRRRCMSCGRAIAAEFLGIKKDYFPCRYADGLFCRSYCHAEDRRVIPHRVVHHWDFVRHRVCKDARVFLDSTRFHPVFDLPALSPTLFTQQQSLRMVQSRRKQLHLLRRTIFFPVESKCVLGAQLFDKLLEGRVHLAVNPGLYSLEDLMSVKNGDLLHFLEETNEVLVAHVLGECHVCEGRAARVCEVCYIGQPVFPFQASLTPLARCPRCETLFHARCVAGNSAQRQTQQQQHSKSPSAAGVASSSSKRYTTAQPGGGSRKWRWPDHQSQAGGSKKKEPVDQDAEIGDNEFVCPKCKSVGVWEEVIGQ
ncbi:unnamed protein product [Ectocarpus sp. 12 AP-2014]